jgi:hypothetical protein
MFRQYLASNVGIHKGESDLIPSTSMLLKPKEYFIKF